MKQGDKGAVSPTVENPNPGTAPNAPKPDQLQDVSVGAKLEPLAKEIAEALASKNFLTRIACRAGLDMHGPISRHVGTQIGGAVLLLIVQFFVDLFAWSIAFGWVFSEEKYPYLYPFLTFGMAAAISTVVLLFDWFLISAPMAPGLFGWLRPGFLARIAVAFLFSSIVAIPIELLIMQDQIETRFEHLDKEALRNAVSSQGELCFRNWTSSRNNAKSGIDKRVGSKEDAAGVATKVPDNEPSGKLKFASNFLDAKKAGYESSLNAKTKTDKLPFLKCKFAEGGEDSNRAALRSIGDTLYGAGDPVKKFSEFGAQLRTAGEKAVIDAKKRKEEHAKTVRPGVDKPKELGDAWDSEKKTRNKALVEAVECKELLDGAIAAAKLLSDAKGEVIRSYDGEDDRQRRVTKEAEAAAETTRKEDERSSKKEEIAAARNCQRSIDPDMTSILQRYESTEGDKKKWTGTPITNLVKKRKADAEADRKADAAKAATATSNPEPDSKADAGEAVTAASKREPDRIADADSKFEADNWYIAWADLTPVQVEFVTNTRIRVPRDLSARIAALDVLTTDSSGGQGSPESDGDGRVDWRAEQQAMAEPNNRVKWGIRILFMALAGLVVIAKLWFSNATRQYFRYGKDPILAKEYQPGSFTF